MEGIPILSCLTIFTILGCASAEKETTPIGCQQRSTSGRTYNGNANTTVDGIPCQKWSETQPHEHSFTHVGDHNFCRNPNGASNSQVWCFTSDPVNVRQNCSVPFCPSLKALDFSLDNDDKADEDNIYTHASLQKKNLPSSLTICTAFMVEAWDLETDAMLLVLYDDNGERWNFVRIYAYKTYTEFQVQFEDFVSITNKMLFYPLQWTRVCLSRDSKTSLSRLVVDGELLVEKK